jgi:transposase
MVRLGMRRKRMACTVLRCGMHDLNGLLLTGVVLEDSGRRMCVRGRADYAPPEVERGQKAALLEEVESAGGKVAAVARRHGISESLLYNWRSAWRAAGSAVSAAESVAFVSLGVVGEAGGTRQVLLRPPEADRSPPPWARAGGAGTIAIALPNGVRICVAGLVSEKALSRVLRAMRGTL